MLKPMERLKIHHLRDARLTQEAIASALDVGVRTIRRVLDEPRPTPAELVADQLFVRTPVGRPSTALPMAAFVKARLAVTPELPTIELLRLANVEGYSGGRSAFFDLVKRIRPKKTREPVVRWEGLPGEYAQFDFGQCRVTYEDGAVELIHFFAGRLKYSRYFHLVLTPNEQAETLVRATIRCLGAFQGAPRTLVFDNPTTVRLRPFEKDKPPRLHPLLRGLCAELNVTVELCTPRRGEEKGSVENLVGFAKKSFFAVRKCRDRAHLAAELDGWLREVNQVRPCDATGQIPARRREEEAHRLAQRPIPWTAADYSIVETGVVTPVALVRRKTASYSAPAQLIGVAVTMHIAQNHIDFQAGDQQWRHVRRDGSREIVRLAEHRSDLLAAIHGRRKGNYFRRQCLLELGPEAALFLEHLVHEHDHRSWYPVVQELYGLLGKWPDDQIRMALRLAHDEGRHDALAVQRHLRRSA